MERYEPPFALTNSMLSLVAALSEKVGTLTAYRNLETHPQLRRNNRIKSVHASLRIEANSLSEPMVRAVLNRREVIGPAREIQEVKNAFAAYDEIDRVDPYSLSDLKRLHGVMTHLTAEDSGEFRSGAEGVFRDGQCIFMAPPAELVPSQMEQLFAWMSENRETVHPLILSSVFHYEFVFIHPFSDGNGRMARLWQTILLSRWNPVFKYIPLESQIEQFQEDYYEAINVCNAAGNSTAFVEFMLARIDAVLDAVLAQSAADGSLSPCVRKLLSVMEYETPYDTETLLSLLRLKSRETLRRNYLVPALRADLVEMTLPDKPTSRNQRYRKK